MKIDTSKGYTVITAEEGMFLTNADMTLYSEIGGSIILGAIDSPESYRELPGDQRPEDPEPEAVEDEINE